MEKGERLEKKHRKNMDNRIKEEKRRVDEMNRERLGVEVHNIQSQGG